jgi:hypothetical protein
LSDGAAFQSTWKARVLQGAPMIAPVRQFTYPHAVAGEEDAMARGALFVDVQPRTGGSFLAMCALGFAGNGMIRGVWAAPEPDEMCAVAGGYAYLIDTAAPERSQMLPLKPVVEVRPLPELGLLLFVGFHHLYVRGRGDVAWQSERLSWEGVTVTRVEGAVVHGLGWDMKADVEVPFSVDLATRVCEGGGFRG